MAQSAAQLAHIARQASHITETTDLTAEIVQVPQFAPQNSPSANFHLGIPPGNEITHRSYNETLNLSTWPVAAPFPAGPNVTLQIPYSTPSLRLAASARPVDAVYMPPPRYIPGSGGGGGAASTGGAPFACRCGNTYAQQKGLSSHRNFCTVWPNSPVVTSASFKTSAESNRTPRCRTAVEVTAHLAAGQPLPINSMPPPPWPPLPPFVSQDMSHPMMAPQKKGICEHGRRRYRCKDCGGSSICVHRREKRMCKQCGGNGLCQHGRDRFRCAQCRGGESDGGVCLHNFWERRRCTKCSVQQAPTTANSLVDRSYTSGLTPIMSSRRYSNRLDD